MDSLVTLLVANEVYYFSVSFTFKMHVLKICLMCVHSLKLLFLSIALASLEPQVVPLSL